MQKGKQYVFEVAQDVPYDITGVQIGYQVRKKLYEGKSAFQKLEVYNLVFFGRTLFLDGVLQTTEQDEFIYHEALCQAPLFVHPSPQKVLIIGGGDGGSLEEVLKHREVKEAWMVEIDKKVVDVSKKYLSSISKKAFGDKRAHLLFEDGKEFVKKHKNEFDIIILDLSDPGGPAEQLISEKFYQDVRRALRKGGVVSVQSGSLTTQAKLVRLIQKRLKKVFRYVLVRGVCVPAYQAGVYSFTMASNFPFPNVSNQVLERKYRKASQMNLQYWSPGMHAASAVLPRYLQEKLT